MLSVFGDYNLFRVKNSFSSAIKTIGVFRKTTYISVSILSLLLLAILFPISFKSATPVEGIAKSANPSTLDFTASSSSASTSFNVTSSSGSSAASITNAAFTLSTNNATGYTLRLKTTGGDTLVDSANSNTSTNHIDPIGTDGITLDQFSNNTWGLLPSKYNGTNNTTNYYKPTTTGFKMDETQAPNASNNANSYTVGLGIKADYTRPAGTYTNTTIVAEYVANAVSYAIYYYANTADSTLDNMPSINPQSGVVSDPGLPSPSGDITVTLASAPTRTGYAFKGWCKGTTSSSNIAPGTGGNADTCNTTVYDAGQSFGINAVDGEGNANYDDIYYLYAMWQRNSYTCTKQYRLENADGTWGSYQADGTEQVLYGETCNYSKSVTNYKNSASGTNNSTATTSGTMTENGLILSLSLYRNTFTITKQYRLQGTDANYPSSYTGDGTVSVRYGDSYTYSRAATTTHQSASKSVSNVTSNQTISLDVPRKTFTVTKQYRLQDTSGNYPSSYTSDGTVSVVYGGSYTYSRAATTTHQAKSGSVSNVTSAQTISLDVPRNLVTCNKRYRLQGADGNYPSSYTGDGSVNAYYGGSCSYSKTVTDYNSNAAKSTSASNVTSTQTLSLDFPRNTYTLTVNRNTTYISSVSGGGTKRWGESVSISATPASNSAFNGWSVSSGSTGSFANANNASTTYTMPKGASTIYANGKSNKIYMQDMTASDCTTTAKTVYDKRDESAYLVQKLADNKCWMLDNLRLGSTSTISLTPSNTNLPSGTNWTLPKSGTVCFAAADYCDGDDPTHTGNTVAAINIASKDTTTTSYGSGSGKIGVYYNYCAATAGGICVYSNSNNASPDRDICPKGWRMPTGGSSGEYQALYTAYSSNDTNFRNALSTPLSGAFIGGRTESQGSAGYFWSATRQDSTYIYYVVVGSSYVGPTAGYRYRYNGTSVRCILK